MLLESQFVYSETENREMMALNRLQGQIDNQQGIKAQASRDQTSALTGAIGGIASAAGSLHECKRKINRNMENKNVTTNLLIKQMLQSDAIAYNC